METPAQSQRLWPVLLGGLLLLLVFAVAAKILLIGIPPAPDEDAARAAERTKAHEELLAENKQKLETYAWVDRAKGTVQMPIDRAMELTMTALNSHPPAPAGPIATPSPTATPTPSASPESSPAAPSAAQPPPAN